jgi:hypothetical protein
MDHVVLDYDDDEFAPKAVRLIRADQPFCFSVRGPAFSLLRPRVRDGKFVDLSTFVLVPKLQPLCGTVTFAQARGMSVLLEEHEGTIGVWIGTARA